MRARLRPIPPRRLNCPQRARASKQIARNYQVRGGTHGESDHLTYDEFHPLCSQRDYARRDSKAVLTNRLSTKDALERTRARDREDAGDTSEDMPVTQEMRCRVEGPRMATVVA